MTAPNGGGGLPRLSGRLPVGPDEHTALRLAQLLLLLAESQQAGGAGIGLERLGYYDFFAANPFLVVGAEPGEDRAALHAAGFDERQLAYSSAGARFASRRQRLQHDVALLVAYGLVAPAGPAWGITGRGREIADGFLALYAMQYRAAARVVGQRLSRLSDKALGDAAREWLKSPKLLLDLYGSPETGPDEDPQ